MRQVMAREAVPWSWQTGGPITVASDIPKEFDPHEHEGTTRPGVGADHYADGGGRVRTMPLPRAPALELGDRIDVAADSRLGQLDRSTSRSHCAEHPVRPSAC
jgi:hypothetical protein